VLAAFAGTEAFLVFAAGEPLVLPHPAMAIATAMVVISARFTGDSLAQFGFGVRVTASLTHLEGFKSRRRRRYRGT
jgi:hypothetical protein